MSARHRTWGYDCPALDLDFLMLEYDTGRATALVEYKHEAAPRQWWSHPSYRALVDLGNRAGLPVFSVRYADDWTRFDVTALNVEARRYVPETCTVSMSERAWVALLYRTRKRQTPPAISRSLHAWVDAEQARAETLSQS